MQPAACTARHRTQICHALCCSARPRYRGQPAEASQAPAGVREQVCDTMRLAAYAAERANVVRALLQRMATLPEAIEIGRVTGLTLGQARISQLWSGEPL